MKGAIMASNFVTTVSPTYAQELRTPFYAHGLDGVINQQSGKLEGILGNASIFGVSLYTAGLADKVTADVKELLAGPGAVRATLKKHLA